MRKYLLAAAAAAAIATPAAARDNSGYIGIEGGVLFATNSDINIDATNAYYYGHYINTYLGTYTPTLKPKYKTGFDIDAIAGYDFGRVRLEARSPTSAPTVDHYTTLRCAGPASTTRAVRSLRPAARSIRTATSRRFPGWSTALVDFGSDDGMNFSIGGGVGCRRHALQVGLNRSGHLGDGNQYVDIFTTTVSKSKFAWQLLAEVRYPVTRSVDIGLKYRYFDGGKIQRVVRSTASIRTRADRSTTLTSAATACWPA